MNKAIYIRIVILFLFPLFANYVYSQTNDIDSLENLLFKYTKRDTVRVNLLNKTANKLFSSIDVKCLKYAEEAQELADKLDFKKGKALSLHIHGLYFFMKSDYPKALDYFHKSLNVRKKIDDKIGMSAGYNNCGVIYSKQGNLIKSLIYHEKALKIREELGDKKGVAQSFNNIGVIFYEMQDYNKAIEYYQKSLLINAELNLKNEVSRGFNNIALIYEKQNKLDESLDYYSRCIKIGEEIDYALILGWAYNGKGIVFEKKQQFNKALEFYKFALEKRENINDKDGIGQSCNSIGNLYLKNRQFKKAQSYLLRAYKIAEEIGNPIYLRNAAKGLVVVYEQSEQFKKSLEYHKIFKQMNDSLINESNIKKLAGFEIEQQYEKEKQAIELEQQKKDAIHMEEAKRHRIVRNSFIAGFILMLLLASIILRSFLQKRKSNKLLFIQKQRIENKNWQLHDQNDEIQQLNEELKVSNEVLYTQKEELEVHRNNLEKLVQERTVDLEIAKEKAEESDRLKSSFLANMSHEIRTPMNAIVGFTNLLNDPELNVATKKELTAEINNNTSTLLNLIENIIDIAKIESKQLSIEKRECKVNEILNKIISIYNEKKIEINKEHIDFLVQKSNKDIILQTDPLKVDQILTNLTDNAFKFTEKGKVEIGTDFQENEKNKLIRFYVKDTGIGLSDKQKEIIFKRFSKIEDDKKKLYRGAGLGLAISKNLVELLGGNLWVDSEKDKGSTFYFTIPF
ncbi:tetratricopeptide repeat protein [Bacteroidota bacterium]